MAFAPPGSQSLATSLSPPESLGRHLWRDSSDMVYTRRICFAVACIHQPYTAVYSRIQPHRATVLVITDCIDELGAAIEKRAYAPPILQPDNAKAKQHWRRLRAELWRLRISSWLRRGQKN